MEEITYISLFYFLLSFILIYPPSEIVTLGLTIQTIFSSYLGSEQMFFIEYHIKRILLQMSIQCFIPLGLSFLFLFFFNFTTFNCFHLRLLFITCFICATIRFIQHRELEYLLEDLFLLFNYIANNHSNSLLLLVHEQL